MERLTEEPNPEANARIAALVLRAKSGQTEAFALIYDEYVGRIYRYVYAETGHLEKAEDLTQEIFLTALSGIRSHRADERPFSVWLVRIAHDLLADHYRRTYKGWLIPFSGLLTLKSLDRVSRDEKETEDTMVEAISSLPPGEREVISLRFAAGLSVAETAEIVQKSQGVVKALQYQAALRLRKVTEKNLKAL